MSIELPAQESGTPLPLEAGTYGVTIAQVEEAPGGTFGDQVKLILLTTDEADDEGNPFEIWAFASRKLTTRSKLYRWVTAITGKAPVIGQTFAIDEILTGKPCRVQLVEAPGEDGQVRKKVSEILAPSKRTAKAQDGLSPFCSECASEVAYYDAKGKGYCNEHGPRGAE